MNARFYNICTNDIIMYKLNDKSIKAKGLLSKFIIARKSIFIRFIYYINRFVRLLFGRANVIGKISSTWFDNSGQQICTLVKRQPRCATNGWINLFTVYDYELLVYNVTLK